MVLRHINTPKITTPHLNLCSSSNNISIYAYYTSLSTHKGRQDAQIGSHNNYEQEVDSGIITRDNLPSRIDSLSWQFHAYRLSIEII